MKYYLTQEGREFIEEVQSSSQQKAIKTLMPVVKSKGQGELKSNPNTRRTYFTDDPRAPKSQRTPVSGRPVPGRDDAPASSRGN